MAASESPTSRWALSFLPVVCSLNLLMLRLMQTTLSSRSFHCRPYTSPRRIPASAV